MLKHHSTPLPLSPFPHIPPLQALILGAPLRYMYTLKKQVAHRKNMHILPLSEESHCEKGNPGILTGHNFLLNKELSRNLKLTTSIKDAMNQAFSMSLFMASYVDTVPSQPTYRLVLFEQIKHF